MRSLVGRRRHGESRDSTYNHWLWSIKFVLQSQQTTYSTCFLLYHIARHPEVQAKVLAEAMAVIPNYETDEITAEKMNNQLSYSKAVLKESFRLNPVSVGVGRTTNTDLVLNGYNVPKGVSDKSWFYNVPKGVDNKVSRCRRSRWRRILFRAVWPSTLIRPRNSCQSVGLKTAIVRWKCKWIRI